MTRWVKIDRATGDVLKRRTEDKLERVFNKPVVWLEVEKKDAPEYDASTHKLTPVVTQPDLSDLSVAEIESNKDAEYSSPITVAFKLGMDQENRIRALEDKSALDLAGFRKHLRDTF